MSDWTRVRALVALWKEKKKMGELSIDRWGVNGKTGGVGELWAFAGVKFKWNQVCCGTSKRGHFCKKMGGQVCESVSYSACDLDVFGILVFGPQTRNLHPGGSARGGLESGEWQCRGPEGGGTAGERRGGGQEWAVSLLLSLSSSPLAPFLPPFACVQLLQLSVCPLTLSGSHRQEIQGTTSVRQLSRDEWSQREGRAGQRQTETGDLSDRDSAVSFLKIHSIFLMSDVHIRRDLCQTGKQRMPPHVCETFREIYWGLGLSFLVQAIHVTVALLCLAPYESQDNVAHSLCSLLLGSAARRQ